MTGIRAIFTRGRLYLPPYDFDRLASALDAKVLDEGGRLSFILATPIGTVRIVRDPEPTAELAAIADAFDCARIGDEPLSATAARVVEERNRYAERLAEMNTADLRDEDRR